jgi:hypothetical protein
LKTVALATAKEVTTSHGKLILKGSNIWRAMSTEDRQEYTAWWKTVAPTYSVEQRTQWPEVIEVGTDDFEDYIRTQADVLRHRFEHIKSDNGLQILYQPNPADVLDPTDVLDYIVSKRFSSVPDELLLDHGQWEVAVRIVMATLALPPALRRNIGTIYGLVRIRASRDGVTTDCSPQNPRVCPNLQEQELFNTCDAIRHAGHECILFVRGINGFTDRASFKYWLRF